MIKRVVWGLISMGIFGACSSTAYQRPTVHRAGPGMSGYYGTRTPGDLAYGRPTGLQPTETQGAFDLDQYLKDQARAPLAKAQPVRAHARARAQAPQLALMPEVALPMIEVPPASAPTTTPTAVPAAPTPPASQAATPSSDAQRYASREAQSSQQQQYRGGDVVVISVSTLLIVLLIVLIVLLLT
jgi:hypothetical protein